MKPAFSFVYALVTLLALPLGASAQSTLESRLKPLIEAHKGDVAVMVKHLETGEAFAWRENEPQATASLIKFPVMIEAYRQSVEAGLDLGQTVTLQEADKVQGSGILSTHFSAGATFALKDAIRLMIAFSDNTATNLVLDQIGLPSTAATMEKLGCPNTQIHSKVFRRDTSVFPERSQQFGLGSTTAAEMIRLCELLHQEKLVSPEASREMLAHLKKCEDKQKFPRLLPTGTVVAFKTGSVNEVRTAAGILYTKGGPVALCVLTAKNADQRWTADNAGDVLCAKIAREVYDHFPARPVQ
jgi:beta-lactamase class A